MVCFCFELRRWCEDHTMLPAISDGPVSHAEKVWQQQEQMCVCVCVFAAASHKMRTLRNCRLMYVWLLFSFLVFQLKLLRNCEIYFVSSQCACNRSCATIIYYYFFHTLLPRLMNLISFPNWTFRSCETFYSLIQLQPHYSISRFNYAFDGYGAISIAEIFFHGQNERNLMHFSFVEWNRLKYWKWISIKFYFTFYFLKFVKKV